MLYELIKLRSIIEDTLIIPEIGHLCYLKCITNTSQFPIICVFFLKMDKGLSKRAIVVSLRTFVRLTPDSRISFHQH